MIVHVREQDSGCKIMPQAQDLWYPIIPVKILSVDVKKIPTRDRFTGRVKDI